MRDLTCLPPYAAGRHARATPGGFTRHHTRTDGTRNSTALARRTHAPPPLRERIERTHHAQAPHARPSPRTIHRERCRHARPLRAHTAPDPANSTWHAATSAINHHAAPPFRRIAPPHTQRTLDLTCLPPRDAGRHTRAPPAGFTPRHTRTDVTSQRHRTRMPHSRTAPALRTD